MNALTLSPLDALQKHLFQPCEISDIFNKATPGVFTLRFGATYQILDWQLNWLVASGFPTIRQGKYAQDCVQKISGPPRAAYVAQELFYGVLFPDGLTIINEITHPTLRHIIYSSSSDDPVVRGMRDYYDTVPDHPALDHVRKETITSYQTTDARILVLRKDVVVGSNIDRDTPRPLQRAPGVYLPI